MGKGAMEASPHRHHHRHQPSLGVRTRAKTKSLALQRLQKAKSKGKSSPCSSSSSSSSSKSSSCYLQLRSRRLERRVPSKRRRAKPKAKRRANPSPVPTPVASPKGSGEEIEASFGENVVEAEGKGSRNSRETTPCSLIKRDSESIGTPGSTTRTRSSTANNKGIQSSRRRTIPNSREMEEFFAVPEERQQKEFAEKYNFDPLKECPLPGRYEWVKINN